MPECLHKGFLTWEVVGQIPRWSSDLNIEGNDIELGPQNPAQNPVFLHQWQPQQLFWCVNASSCCSCTMLTNTKVFTAYHDMMPKRKGKKTSFNISRLNRPSLSTKILQIQQENTWKTIEMLVMEGEKFLTPRTGELGRISVKGHLIAGNAVERPCFKEDFAGIFRLIWNPCGPCTYHHSPTFLTLEVISDTQSCLVSD